MAATSRAEILGDTGELDPELVQCLHNCPMLEVSRPLRAVHSVRTLWEKRSVVNAGI